MWILITGLLALALFAMIAGVIHNRRVNQQIAQGELSAFPEIITADATCCGQHELCEKDSLLAGVSKQIDYYDDEELDRFIGWRPEHYTPTEVHLFYEVFYTMQEVDVAGWVRSLQLRDIPLPNELKDEVFLILTERRKHP